MSLKQNEEWLDNMAYQLEMCYLGNHLAGVMKIQEDMKNLGYEKEAKQIIDNLRDLTRKKHVYATLNHA